tara:strand:- start:372 stop:509 length:138 start_codon:yes stop_codon:yes gene_type:complete
MILLPKLTDAVASWQSSELVTVTGVLDNLPLVLQHKQHSWFRQRH